MVENKEVESAAHQGRKRRVSEEDGKGKSSMTPRDMKIIEVPKWCYEGRHSVERLCPMDECGTYPEVVLMNGAACEINQKIFLS